MKKLKVIFKVFLVCHFTLIVINQFDYFKYIKIDNKLNELAKKYTNPFFEQNWGMFAPNPPHGNQYVIVKYKTKNDSLLIDIHQKISESSIFSIFSINQRILKYQNECYNDIIKKVHSKTITFNNINIHNSHGLESLLNYSKFSLLAQNKFSQNIKDNDSVFVDLYLMDEILNKPNEKPRYRAKQYIELKNIFLCKYQSL